MTPWLSPQTEAGTASAAGANQPHPASPKKLGRNRTKSPSPPHLHNAQPATPVARLPGSPEPVPQNEYGFPPRESRFFTPQAPPPRPATHTRIPQTIPASAERCTELNLQHEHNSNLPPPVSLASVSVHQRFRKTVPCAPPLRGFAASREPSGPQSTPVPPPPPAKKFPRGSSQIRVRVRKTVQKHPPSCSCSCSKNANCPLILPSPP